MAIATYTGSIPSSIKRNKTWTIYSDSKTATVSAASNPSQPTTKIKYNNGYYYFGTSSGYIYTSTDAKTWNITTQVVTAQVNDIAYNGTIWVVISDNANELRTSTDLVTWTTRTSQISGTGSLRGVEWIPAFNRFICIGAPNASTWVGTSSSTDGVTWTAGTANGQTVAWACFQIAYDGSGTVVVNTNVATTANGLFTTNGTTWTNTNMANGVSAGGSSLWYAPSVGRFCYGSSYSQTPANLATAWATTTYSGYTGPNTINRLSGNNEGPYSQGRVFLYNAIDNVYYNITSSYNSTGGAWPPTMYTFDGNPVLTSFTTGTSNTYAFPLLHSEYIPISQTNATNPITYTQVTMGYGNGIWVVALYQNSTGGAPVIFSTAT